MHEERKAVDKYCFIH